MKKLIVILFLISTTAWSQECVIRPIPQLRKVIVEPVYLAQANFVFNEKDQTAFALVSWRFDEASTRICVTQAKEESSDQQIIIARFNPSDLELFVEDGFSSSALRVYPLANGQWMGDGETIKLPFSSKAKIQDSIEAHRLLIKVRGSLTYTTDWVSREPLGSVSCISGRTSDRTLDVFTRFSEILRGLERRDPREALDLEEIAEAYVNTCLDVSEFETKNFETLFRGLSVKGRLKSGEFSFRGNVYTQREFNLSTELKQNSQLISI